MGWKVVEVNSGEYLRLYLNNLLIIRTNEKILLNINDIDTLILHNDRTVLSVRLINALTMKNVNIVIFNQMYEPQSHIFPVQGHHKSLKIFEAQLQWNNQFKGLCWKHIIQNKIWNQITLLKKIGAHKPTDNLETMADNVKVFDPSNREGHAAKIYWHRLIDLKFIRDYKGQHSPHINGMLNYGYTILRSLVIRSIIKKGLDPRISFFHKSFSNFYALASDLMEPFRPLVDHIAWKHRDAILFDIHIRDELVNLINHQVIVDGKKYYLNNAVDLMIDRIVRQEKWLFIKLWD